MKKTHLTTLIISNNFFTVILLRSPINPGYTVALAFNLLNFFLQKIINKNTPRNIQIYYDKHGQYFSLWINHMTALYSSAWTNLYIYENLLIYAGNIDICWTTLSWMNTFLWYTKMSLSWRHCSFTWKFTENIFFTGNNHKGDLVRRKLPAKQGPKVAGLCQHTLGLTSV